MGGGLVGLIHNHIYNRKIATAAPVRATKERYLNYAVSSLIEVSQVMEFCYMQIGMVVCT